MTPFRLRVANNPLYLEKMPDDFDIENYAKEVFFMFSGEKVLVDLRCDNTLMKTMVDRFGEDVTTLRMILRLSEYRPKYQPVQPFSVGCLALMARYRYLHRKV